MSKLNIGNSLILKNAETFRSHASLHSLEHSDEIIMVRKRLSREYMELLMRNQKTVNVIREEGDNPDSDICRDSQKCANSSENINGDVVTNNPNVEATLGFPVENFVEGNALEGGIIHKAGDETSEACSLYSPEIAPERKHFLNENEIEWKESNTDTSAVLIPRNRVSSNPLGKILSSLLNSQSLLLPGLGTYDVNETFI